MTEIQKWDDLDLKDDLLRGIYAYGFETPSDIQKQAILPMIQKRDLLAQAQSGSGKTGSFTIGTLQLIDTTQRNTQAVIMAPTHELARQISDVVVRLGQFMEHLTVKTLVGGTSMRDDIREIQDRPPHIIVGCAGRIYGMFEKRIIQTDHLKLLVLDEADEMLSQGFLLQIKEMFRLFFDETMQVVLFSATMPHDIEVMTESFLHNPVRILVKKEELSLKCIQQFFAVARNDSEKYDLLQKLFSVISVSKSIIYCNNVKRVIDLFQSMQKDGYSVCHIHSAMDKTERDAVFNHFKTGDARVLISSDITARGIDVQQVSTVVNFDIPRNVHTYLHRIGRGGRWGRKGFAINFVTRLDVFDMKQIEAHYEIEIKELPTSFDGKIY